MFLYVLNASPLIAKSLCNVLFAEFFDEVCWCPAHVPWEVDHIDALQDNVVGLHGVRGVEGRTGTQEAVEVNMMHIGSMYTVVLPI